MKQLKNKNKNKTRNISIPLNLFKKIKTPDLKLRAAAKKVVKEINSHMKNDGWPLNYQYYKDTIFYDAYGHNLENYLLWAMASNKNSKLELTTKNGTLVIKKSKQR